MLLPGKLMKREMGLDVDVSRCYKWIKLASVLMNRMHSGAYMKPILFLL